VKPALTFGRAGAFAVVLMIAAALTVAMLEGLLPRDDVVDAILAGMTAVALGGALLLAVSQTDAMHPGTGRLNGLGGDPNTVSSMVALGVPLALGLAFASRGRRRWNAVVILAILLGTIIASGSRGSLLAAAAGALVVAILAVRGRRARATAALAVAVATLAAAALGSGKPLAMHEIHVPVPTGSIGQKLTGPAGHRVYLNAELTHRLEDDIGAGVPGSPQVDTHRSFLNSSGRTQAWVGALGQAAERPLVGYGFGTESSVFVDRYVAFQGGYVENAYFGLFLQLGTAGLLLLGVALVVVGRRVRHGLSAADDAAAGLGTAFTGAVVAGLVLATSQSFPFSAGNVAVLTFWTALIAAPAMLTRRAR
jgi:O-antigen ligase